MTITKLARKTVQALTPYQSARRLVAAAIFGSTLMNPLSPTITALAAID